MNTHSSIAAEEALEAAGPSDPDAERTEQLLRALARLTELGMVLAERLVAQATVDDVAPTDAGEVSTAFAKVARGMRMTVMLETRLLKARRLRRDGLEAAHEAKLAAMREARWAEEREAENERIETQQKAIDEAVKDIIRAERPEGYERERLFDRLGRVWVKDLGAYEKLVRSGGQSLYDEMGGEDALVSKQIAAFCEALGLTPDWDLWKDSDWAIEEAEDEAEGSPYAAPHQTPLPSGEVSSPLPPRLQRSRAIDVALVEIDLGLLGRQGRRVAEALAVVAADLLQPARPPRRSPRPRPPPPGPGRGPG